MKIAHLSWAPIAFLLLTSATTASAADGDTEGSSSNTEASPSASTTTTTTPAASEESGDGPAESGLSLGARVGFGLPLGEAAEGSDLSDGITGSVPIFLDVGYRGLGIRNLYLGAFGTWGPAFYKDCPSGASCSASIARFGINARWHFLPAESIDPYAGVGLGYEFASSSAEANGNEVSSTLKGFEFFELQGGLDFKATPALRVGPFVNLAMGQYSSADVTLGGTSSSTDIDKTAMHMWLIFGGRAQFDL